MTRRYNFFCDNADCAAPLDDEYVSDYDNECGAEITLCLDCLRRAAKRADATIPEGGLSGEGRAVLEK